MSRPSAHASPVRAPRLDSCRPDGEPHEPTPQDVYALRELADITYHSYTHGNTPLPEMAGLDFAKDPPSALKMRLALLPSKERATVLVHELAVGQVSLALNDYEMQLAIDEGAVTVQAVDSELQGMDSQPGQKKAAGYAARFRVLGGIGDPAQAPVVARYLHDPDGDTGYFA